MLSTLIRYDFKRLLKITLPLCGGSILAAGLFDLIFWRMEHLTQVETYLVFPYGLLMILCAFGIAGAFGAVVIFVCSHFQKNLMTDEGYLTFTLPATHNQILASKVITGVTCALLAGAAMIIGYFILGVGVELLSAPSEEIVEIDPEVEEAAASAVLTVLLMLLVYAITSVARIVLQIYFAVVAGHSFFKSHKGIASFGIYVASNMVIGFISSLVTVGFGSFLADVLADGFITPSTSLPALALLGSAVLDLILCAVFYLWTLRLLKTRLNLT